MSLFFYTLSKMSYPQLYEFFCDRYNLDRETGWELLIKIQKYQNDNKSVKEFLTEEFKRIGLNL